MTAIRLYTEEFPNLPDLSSKYFDGFNVSRAIGAWKGTLEQASIIEILVEDSKIPKAFADALLLAGDIKRENKQQSVMPTKQTIDAHFV